VYPTLTPVDIGSIDLVDLVEFNLRAPPPSSATSAQALSTVDKGKDREAVGEQTIDPKLINNRAHPPPHDHDDIMVGTSLKPLYCDDRLSRVKIGFWTNVPLSDAAAAAAISFYLETDYGINGFFDADVFLDDLLARRLENCSAFLVNAVLCLACVSDFNFAIKCDTQLIT
jgi:hypothetical protein